MTFCFLREVSNIIKFKEKKIIFLCSNPKNIELFLIFIKNEVKEHCSLISIVLVIFLNKIKMVPK